jgi:phosphoglycolate phosphatase-like HAD superfamily hydrolase
MLRLITDFDGPIVDVSERYYQVYQFCLDEVRRPGQPIHRFSKDEFWQLKRSRVPERQIGQLSGLDENQGREFALLRRNTVHTAPYLQFDRLIPGAIAALQRVQHLNIDLVVMTMRRAQELDYALRELCLSDFFPSHQRYCRGSHAIKTTDVEEKTLLMNQALCELPSASVTWMVGDTEADIIAAKTHGIPVIAVLSGIRDRPRLLQYNPDWVVQDLNEAIDIIATKSVSHMSPRP